MCQRKRNFMPSKSTSNSQLSCWFPWQVRNHRTVVAQDGNYVFFSRGVLEAEQLRYQKLHEEQKKELEDTKSTFELKLESLNAREAAIEKRMSDFEQKELELAQSKADLKQKWNEYQQHAEALRNTRNRLPAEIPAHTHSTSKHENSLNSSNISTASSSLHSAPKKQPRPRENPSREHARRSDNNQIQRKDNNQLPLRDQIFV